MVRLIHSELRSKKVSEWTIQKLQKQKRELETVVESRPKAVLMYNKKKELAYDRARFNLGDKSDLN
jgi:hypothetical protein